MHVKVGLMRIKNKFQKFTLLQTPNTQTQNYNSSNREEKKEKTTKVLNIVILINALSASDKSM